MMAESQKLASPFLPQHNRQVVRHDNELAASETLLQRARLGRLHTQNHVKRVKMTMMVDEEYTSMDE